MALEAISSVCRRFFNRSFIEPLVHSRPEFGGREVLAEYEFGPTLGCGTFGVTRLVTHRKTAQPWACKTICKASLSASPAAQSDVQHEVAILQHLAGHHGVVQLQGVYEDERNIHLVMEVCTGGDLLDYISRFGRLQEAEAADVAGVMLRTLQHCHALGVVHRDIKPENFLLGAPTPLMPPAGSAASALKMSDFGVSAFCAPGEHFSEIVGTPFYMAPEVIERCYAFPADVWSVGVVIYLMVAGRLPFTGSTDRQIIKAVMDSQPDFEEGLPALGKTGNKLCALEKTGNDSSVARDGCYMVLCSFITRRGPADRAPEKIGAS
eukprot:gene11940-12083_t